MKPLDSALPPCSDGWEMPLSKHCRSVFIQHLHEGCLFQAAAGTLHSEGDAPGIDSGFPIFCSALCRAIGGWGRGILFSAAGAWSSPFAPRQHQRAASLAENGGNNISYLLVLSSKCPLLSVPLDPRLGLVLRARSEPNLLPFDTSKMLSEKVMFRLPRRCHNRHKTLLKQSLL